MEPISKPDQSNESLEITGFKLDEGDFAPIDESQQEQNDILESKGFKLASKREFQDLLKKNADSSLREASPDPIAEAVRLNPGLTREEAIKMAEEFGF